MNKTKNNNVYKTIDLFLWVWGNDKGLDLAGSNKLGKFKCVNAIDNWNSACKTFTRNFKLMLYVNQFQKMLLRMF